VCPSGKVIEKINQDQSRNKRCRAVRYRNLSRSEEYRYA
jgi:hypothetical protein